MTLEDLSTLREQIKADEGLRLKPYMDTTGHVTIGYGHRIPDISPAEAADILQRDIEQHVADLFHAYPFVQGLSAPRQIALCNMAFNMGLPRLSQFVNMWDAIQRGDFNRAADEMLASRWAEQVGQRAMRLAAVMRDGLVPVNDRT